MTERWVWISGWAISTKDFRRAATAWKPQAEHHFAPPSPRAVDQARALSPSHLGACTGFLSCQLKGRFKYLECSDLSAEMLKECAQHHPYLKLSIRDAWQKTSKPEYWNHLASASLLQWSPNPPRTLKNWQQLLRPGGYLWLVFYAKPSLPELESILKGEGVIHWRSPEKWRDLFIDAGFHLCRMEHQVRQYDYPSALHFWKSLHGTGASVRRKMKPSQMMRFFREYEREFTGKEGVYATWNFCRVQLRAPG